MADTDILGMRNRLDRLEAQVRTLSEHLGIPFDDGTSNIPQEVVDLVRAEKRLQAVKRYAELTGADLGTAKDVVSGL